MSARIGGSRLLGGVGKQRYGRRLAGPLKGYGTRVADRDRRAPYGVSVHASLLDAAVVARLLRRVQVVMTWPVNDVPALERALATGANGIISDEPDIVREVLNRRPRPPAP